MELERSGTLASLYNRQYKFPKDVSLESVVVNAGLRCFFQELHDMWEDLLVRASFYSRGAQTNLKIAKQLCQFHDTMSGSGIAMIHEDQRQKYRAIMVKGKHLLEEAYRTLYQGSSEVSAATKVSSAEHLVAINPIPGISRREVIPVCLKTAPGLRSACAQVDVKKTRGYIIAETSRANASVANITGLFGDSPPASAQEAEAGVFNLQNSSLSMTIKGGRITSIYDRIAKRELIADGLSAGFVIYRDHPRSWDAWEVDISHLETRRPLKFSEVNILEKGPVRATVACVVDEGSSKIEVKVSRHLKVLELPSLTLFCFADFS